MMNNEKIILILLKILDKIQEDNENARKAGESVRQFVKKKVFLFNGYFIFCFLILIL